MGVNRLRVEEVTKRFGAVAAVDRLSLGVAEGEAVVFLGPSGCGKTTLLKLIAGFHAPDQGRIVMDGMELSSSRSLVPPDKRRMGMVFQSYAIWPHKTVYENVAFGLRIRKEPKAEIDRKTRGALALVHLEGLEDRYATQLSGGQQQRVALARALVVEPAILLLDEPLSNLDAALREEMRNEIRELKEKLGITFVYVTHDQAEAMAVGDRVILMKEGKIIQESTPRELYTRPKSSFAASFIGKSNLLAVTSGGDSRSARNGSSVLSCAFGELLLAAAIPTGRPGQTLKISVRPELVQLLEEADPNLPNVFPGTITRQQFYGKSISYQLRVGDVSLSAETPAKQDYPMGTRVFVHLPPETCVPVLDEEAEA